VTASSDDYVLVVAGSDTGLSGKYWNDEALLPRRRSRLPEEVKITTSSNSPVPPSQPQHHHPAPPLSTTSALGNIKKNETSKWKIPLMVSLYIYTTYFKYLAILGVMHISNIQLKSRARFANCFLFFRQSRVYDEATIVFESCVSGDIESCFDRDSEDGSIDPDPILPPNETDLKNLLRKWRLGIFSPKRRIVWKLLACIYDPDGWLLSQHIVT
jgi:hypothetical protein